MTTYYNQAVALVKHVNNYHDILTMVIIQDLINYDYFSRLFFFILSIIIFCDQVLLL